MTDTSNGRDPSKDTNGSGQTPKETPASGSVAKTEDSLMKLSLQELLSGQNARTTPKDMSNYKFWGTQPVPRFNEDGTVEDGPIEEGDPEKVPKEPYPLIDGFEWVTMDMNDKTEVDDVYQLLFQNYVEDDEAMFRFKYSASFLNWALKSPGWRKEWHVGIRASSSRKLVAFISAVPITLRVRSKTVNCSEVNFLCIHKKLRSKRLAPVLIREITRRCHVVGIWQAIYTAGVMLPTPISTCRYYHRSLDWPKLNEVGFSPMPAGSTKSRQVMKYRLPEKTAVNGVRAMKKQDLPVVKDLLNRYLSRTDLAQHYTEDELEHWMLNDDTSSTEQVIWSFVVETGGKITDFFSFYCLESTVVKSNDKHKSIRAAYMFYYATETAFQGNGKDTAALRKRLNQLMNDALILAKKANFDVFNALSLGDNPLFLQEQKFGPGDGRLHFYLYNYRTAPIAGGIDEKSNLDETRMNGVGVVML